jgi:transcriptional regulator with PAS, ATPase and Fis domain
LHGTDVTGLSPEALALFMEHDFPGNVRELENVLEHAFVLCHAGLIAPRHLPSYLRREPEHGAVVARSGASLRTVEKALIQDVLHKHAGNRSLAAAELGINPSTLFRKLKQLHIDVPQTDGRTRRPSG